MTNKKPLRYEAGILIYSNEEYRYKCRVCSRQKDELKEPCWKQHRESEQHYYAYKNYTKYFTNDTYDSMTCTLCSENVKINWYQLKDHASLHRLPPWSYPDLKVSRLFENFTIQGKDYNYNCHLCKQNFLFWWQAYEHTSDVNHLELRRKMYPDSQLTKFNLSKPRILYCRQKRVFPLSDKMVWCWVCDEKILIPNIDEHCDEPRHLAAKRRAVELSKEKEKEKLPLEVVNESRENCNDNLCQNDEVDDEYKTTGSQTNSSEKLESKGSVKTTKPSIRQGHRYACSICNIRLIEKDHIELHINGSLHKDQLEKLKTKFEKEKNLDFNDLPIGIKMNDAEKFKCALCESNALTFSNLISHIHSENHLMNLGDLYNNSPLSPNSVLPGDKIISTKLHNVFYCALCGHIIRGAKNITGHVQESDHQRVLNLSKNPRMINKQVVKHQLPKKLLEIAKSTLEFPPEIKFIDCKKFYWCAACECILLQPLDYETVDNSTKIWKHVAGNNHYFNKKRFNEKRLKQQNEELSTESIMTIINDEEINSIPIEELYDVQLKNGEIISVSCKPCEMHIYGNLEDLLGDWNHHLTTKSHLERLFSMKKNITIK